MSSPSRVAIIAAVFLKLGLTSFGGPAAHLGYFHTEFVERRRWLDERAYADLVALCQFLPGPASSQVAFGIGLMRGGGLGALSALLAFMLPSTAIMIGFAYGVSRVEGMAQAGWVHGLKLAAAGVVAFAVIGMWRKLCPDWTRSMLCLVAASILLIAPGVWSQVGVIVGSGVLGWVVFRSRMAVGDASDTARPGRPWAAVALLIVFVSLLLLLPALAERTGSRVLGTFDAFYRSGALVFGGGHVILPLLRSEVVPPGWISEGDFLAGYGAAQAIPGPLFTFAGYLGAMVFRGPQAWLGGLWCVLGVMLPSCLLVGGVWPYWHWLRSRRWAQAALRGTNAAVVGLLLAALWNPILIESVASVLDAVVVVVACGLLMTRRVPVLVVVLACALVGATTAAN